MSYKMESEHIDAAKEASPWEEHSPTIDSGACDHACSDSSLGVPTTPGEKSTRGVLYEVANGDEISSIGENDAEQDGGAFIECKTTCEKLSLTPDDNLWTLKALVRRRPGETQDFARQQSSP